MYSVRKILRENWNSYLKTNNPTKHQKAEIQKMLDCSKNSCNSRICNACGKRYADSWSENIVHKLRPFPQRHFVLTVPSFLRPILRNWKNLDVLLRSSNDFFKRQSLEKLAN